MKAEKKIKFNPKSGMALPAVLILLMIVSILGTAVYAYSMQSIKSVRFASDAKKAEYLARAGIESVAYAYQQATDRSSSDAVRDFMAAYSGNSANKIVSNDVYLVWSNGEYKYVIDNGNLATEYGNKNIIGYFRVTVDEMGKTFPVTVTNYKTDGSADSTSQKDIKTGVKLFTSAGYAGDSSRVKNAYLDDAVVCSGLYYGADGVVDGQYTDGNGNANQDGNHTTALNQASTPFVQSGSYHTTASIQYKWKWLSSWFPNIFSDPDPTTVADDRIPFALAYSAGNMIVNQPSKDVKTITFQPNQSNFVSFVAMDNLFVQTNIDAKSSNGCFNSIVLKGQKIVIDGDLELSAYGFTRKNTGLFGTIATNAGVLSDMLNQRYRYGTVTVACIDDAENRDFSDNNYSTPPYQYTRSGTIYFGGNVYVNITMPNVGTYRYNAFSAGDVYYFDADYKNTRKNVLGIEDPNSPTDSGSGGIDLFRYFLEKSIATNRYSANVLGRFSDLIDFYYGNSSDGNTLVYNDAGTVATRAFVQYNVDESKMSTGGTLLYDAMRKVDNSKDNAYGDSLSSIVPPNPGDASALKWGKPPEIDD